MWENIKTWWGEWWGIPISILLAAGLIIFFVWLGSITPHLYTFNQDVCHTVRVTEATPVWECTGLPSK